MIDQNGAVLGGLRWVLRAEGLALFALSTCGFALTGFSFWLYGLLFLAPDVGFAGYWLGPRVGAIVYNALHSTVAPASLAGVGFMADAGLALALAAIWGAHIGFDRALGYGLKYASAFQTTHLGRIGRSAEGRA